MDEFYDFRHELRNLPWRLVEQMEPPPFKTFRSEFHMSSTNEHSTTYTSTTHYSKQYIQTKSTKRDYETTETDNITNGKSPPDKYTTTTHITQEPIHNYSMQFSEIKSLKRVHKVHEGIGTDTIIDSPGIVNPFTGETMTVQDAIASRILDVRTGKILASPDGTQITIEEAVTRKLIDEKIAQRLYSPCGVQEEGRNLTLLEAIQREIQGAEQAFVDPTEKRLKVNHATSIDQAINDGKVDLNTGTYRLESGELLTTKEAFEKGYLYTTHREFKLKTGAISLYDAINQGLIDERTGWIVDRNSGNKYQIDAAVRTNLIDGDIREIIDPKTDTKITVIQALEKGIINPKLAKYIYSHEKLQFLEAKRRQFIVKPMTLKDVCDLNLINENGFISSPLHQKYLTLLEAISHGVIDSNSVKSILNAKTGKYVTLNDALALGIILPDSKFVDTVTNEVISIKDAVNRGYIVSVAQKSIFDIDGFQPPDKSEYISFNSASSKGFISVKDNGSLVTNLKSGKLISFSDGSKSGEVKPEVFEMLNLNIGVFEEGRELSVIEAVFKGYIDPKTGNFIDIKKNKIVPLNDAIAQNLITADGAALLNSILTINVTTQTTSKLVQRYVTFSSTSKGDYSQGRLSYTEALQRGYIDNRTQTYVDPESNEIIPLVQAINDGKIVPDTEKVPKNITASIKSQEFIQNEQNSSYEIPRDGWLLKEAIDRRLFDPISGLFAVTGTDRLVSFEECIELKYINPNSALVVDPKSKRKISLIRALDKKILDGLGRYNSQLNMKEAISKNLIVFEDLKMDESTTSIVINKNCNFDAVSCKIISKSAPPQSVLEAIQNQIIPEESIKIQDPENPGKYIGVNEAIHKGVIKVDTQEYVDKNGGVIKIDDAIKSGDVVIVADQEKIGEKSTIIIKDPKTGKTYSPEDALKIGLIKPENLKEISLKTPEIKTMKLESIDLEDGPTPAEITRSRVTIEPTYKVSIGRVQSLSPDRDAKKVVLQKLRKKVVRPKDALQKGLVDPATVELLQKPASYGDAISLQEAVEQGIIDGDQGKIVDPQRGDVININEAISRGILDPSGTNEVLIPLNRSLSIPELFEQGLIDESTGKIVHPETGAHLTLQDAIACDIVDPLSTMIDPQGKTLTLTQAIEKNLVDGTTGFVNTQQGPINLETAVIQKVFDDWDGKEGIPKAGMTFQVALSRGLIDLDKKTFTHPTSGEKIPIEEAVDANYIMAIPYAKDSEGVNILDALNEGLINADNGTFKLKNSNDIIPVSEAIESGLLIIKPQQSLAPITTVTETVTAVHTVTTKTIELLSGYILTSSSEIQNVSTGEIISLEEAKLKGIVGEITEAKNITTLRDIKMSFSDAVNKGLIDLKNGIFTDPKSGEKISIKDALESGVLEAAAPMRPDGSKTTELDISEAFETIYDQKTEKFIDPIEGKEITFKEALQKEIIDPNSIIYDVTSKQSITIEQAVQKGLIDEKTGKVKDEKTGKGVDFKKAAKMGLVAIVGGLAAPVIAPVLAVKAAKDYIDKKKSEIKKENETTTIENAIKQKKINPKTCKIILDGNEFKIQDGLGKKKLEPNDLIEIIDKNKAVLIPSRKDDTQNKIIPLKEALKYINNPNLFKIVYKSKVLPYSLDEALINNKLDPKDGVIIKGNIIEIVQPTLKTIEILRIDTEIIDTEIIKTEIVTTQKKIKDAILNNDIDPVVCRIIHENQEFPYTIQDGLMQGYISPDNLIGVVSRNRVILLNEEPLDIAEFALQKLEDNREQYELIPVQSALSTDKVNLETCVVILDGEKLNYSIKEALVQKIIYHYDALRVINKDLVVVVDEKLPSLITVSKDLTPQKLAEMGYYDLQRKCFIDPHTKEPLSFYKLLFLLNAIDPETLYVKNLSIKKPTYVTMDEAIDIPLLDREKGYMVDRRTGKHVSFFEALKIKWIVHKNDLPKEKRQPLTLQEIVDTENFNLKTIKVTNPENGNELSLIDSLKYNVVDPQSVTVRDPKNMQLLPYFDAVDYQIVDQNRGVLVNTSNKKAIDFSNAFLKGYVLGIPRAMSLKGIVEQKVFDPETEAIIDPLTKQQLTIQDALNRNILDGNITEIYDNKNKTKLPIKEALVEEIILGDTGRVLNRISGELLPLIEAIEKDFVQTKPYTISLLDAILLDYYLPKTGEIFDPRTGAKITLQKAIETKFIDPNNTKIKQDETDQFIPLTEAIDKKLIDDQKGILTKPSLTLDQALKKGYILSTSLPWSLQDTLALKLYNPENGKLEILNKSITLTEAIENNTINPEILTVKHPKSGEIITLGEAIATNLINPEKGVVLDDNNEINLYEALERGIIVPAKSQITLPEAIFKGYYNPETGKFVNTKNKEKLKTDSAINRGFLDTSSTLVTIDEDMVTFDQAMIDGFIDTEKGILLIDKNRPPIDFNEAFERGLMVEVRTPMSLVETLVKGIYDDERQMFLDPRTGNYLTLIEAIEIGLIDSDSVSVKDTKSGVWRKLHLIDAIHNGYIDGNTGKVKDFSKSEVVELNLQDALAVGVLIDNKAATSLQRAIHQGLYESESGKITDPNSNRKISLHESIRNYIINPLLPCYFDKKDSTLLDLNETCRLGIIDKRKGEFIDPITNEILPLDKALDLGYIVDIETANFGLYEAIQMGLFIPQENVLIHPGTGGNFTLKEACAKDLINPNLSIIKDVKSNKYIKLPSAIENGLLNDEQNIYNLPNGNEINLIEAKEKGLIVTIQKNLSLEEAIKNLLYRPESGKFVDVANNTFHDLKESIEIGLINPNTTVLKDPNTNVSKPLILAITDGAIDVEKGRVLDSKSKQTYNLDKAFEKGLLITLDKPIENQLNKNIISKLSASKTPRECTLEEAIKFDFIDPKIAVIKDPNTGSFKIVEEAIENKILDPSKMITFEPYDKLKSFVANYDQTLTIFLKEPISLEQAIEKEHLDIKSGKFTDPLSNEILTLKESITLGYIDPDTGLVKDTNKKKLVKLPEGFRRGLVDAEKGNVLDSGTSKLYSLASALDSGLLMIPRRSFTLTESITYGLYNPTTGGFANPFVTTSIIDRKRLTLSEAIEDNLIDPSSTVIKCSETGTCLPLLNAIDTQLVDGVGGKIYDKNEDKMIDFMKAQERGLILPAVERQAVEEKYKLCDETLSKLLQWIEMIEEKIATQDIVREVPEELRNQINTMKQIRDDLDQHSGQVSHIQDKVRQLVLTAGDILSKSEVSMLEKNGRNLKTRYEKACDRTDKLLRKLVTARDELSKLKGELTNFSSWLSKARRVLEDKERALSDLQRLDTSVDSTKEFVSDVIAHQADLRFITMSAQKFVDESKEYLNILNDFRTTLPSRLPHIEPLASQDSPVRNEVSLVTQQYRDLLHRANNLSDRLSGVGGRQKEYGDALSKAQAWLRDVEPRVHAVLNEPIAGDPKTVEDQLHHAKTLNNELVANGRLIDNAKQATSSLLNSLEGQISPSEIARLEEPVVELDMKYTQLKEALADRCQELDTALVQSQGVQDALDGIITWLTMAENQFKNLQKPASLIRERLEEQLREHRVFQSDVDTHVSSIDSVYLSASELISSTSNARVAKKIETKLNDVRTRFEKLYDRVEKRGEFLNDVSKHLSVFTSEADQFEEWYNGVMEIIESRDFTKLSIEEYSSRMKDIAANRDDKRALFEDVIKTGKDLVNKRDVIDTSHIRDRVKSMENNWRDLNMILDEKQKLSKQRAEQLNAYESLREQVNDWLSRMEHKIARLDSVAVEIETLKRQAEELKPIVKEYRDYSTMIDKINDVGNMYDSLLRGDRSDSPSRRRQFSPTKRPVTSPLRRPSQDGRSPSPTKGISPLSPGGSSGFSSRRSSQDGFHLEDLSPVQQQLSEINNRYNLLGVKISDRQNEIDVLREELKKHMENLRVLSNFLDKVQRQIPKDMTTNTKEEADKAQRQLKQILEEMYEKQSLLDSTKSQIKDLLRRKPNALGTDNLNGELEEVAARWKALNDMLKDRIRFTEDFKEFLDTHDSLSSWLSSKDRMLTVLGPISCDPRMVQSQVQQVQVLREEFRSQQPQLQHFLEVGDSVLAFLGPNTNDGRKVNDKIGVVQKRWAELLAKLEERADSLGAAADTSREFDAQLTRLRDGLQAISDNLDELPLDKDPEEQLRKVENLERQLEGQRPLLADLETAGAQLCEVLSDPASRADIQAKLASVGRQYNALQKKLDHRKAEIEGSLRDGRQFEASCSKTLGWLSDELGSLSERLLVSADRDVLEQQLAHHEPIYRDVLAREHEIIMLLNKGKDLKGTRDNRTLQRDLDKIQTQWDKLRKETVERQTRLQTCMEHCKKYYRSLETFLPWLRQAEDKLDSLKPSSFKRKHIEKQLKELQSFRNEVWKRSGEYENTKSLGETFFSACDIDKDIIKNELTNLKSRWEKLNNDLIQHTQSLEDQAHKLSDFNENLRDLQHGVERCEDKLASHDALGGAARDPKMLDRIKNLREEAANLKKPLQTCKNQAADLIHEARENHIDANHLQDEVDGLGDRIQDLQAKLDDRCSELQSAATAVTQFNEQVKGLSQDLSGLEAELDGMKPPGRDFKTVKTQIEDCAKLIKKLNKAADCVNEAISSGERLVDSGFAPDTAQTREQVNTLNKQLNKLEDRAKSRENDLDSTMKKLEEFYLLHAGVLDDVIEAMDQLRKLKPVGSDVETIRAQQDDFKKFRAKIEPLSRTVDECNRNGQGLIQSASPGVNTSTLEKDLEKMNEKWNDLKEKINDRERRLDVALLQSGKFQEALDGLAKWLTDTEDLVANQKPPSADYKVVKAQLQEQKFLKKMLLDRQNSMSSLFSMGNEIAKEAEPSERKAIEKQLKDLMVRFDALTEGAQQRTLDLEQAMRVAKQFQDKLISLQEWLDKSERKIKDMELIPTDEEKIQQRIREHGVLHNDILNKKVDFNELTDIASNLMSLVGEDEAIALGEKLQEVTDRYGTLVETSENIGQLLADSRQGLRHLVLTYQDLAAWMDSMEQRLGKYKVLAVHPEKLLGQMDDLASLTEDIASRQQDVDSTVDTGVELMRHISSDEALHLKDKLDSLQRRYNELTSRGADLLKHAQVMLPLVQQFHNSHNRLVEWMQEAEGILQSAEPHEDEIARLEIDLQELRPVLENINLVGPQLSQASPGEGAATIEGLVTRDNRRFDAIAEQIQRRAERIHLGKQRALEVTTDIDELLEWFREVESQIRDAEKPSAEPDLIRVQLKEHKALNDDISSQKSRVRDVLSTAKKVLRESPPSDDTSLIREKMEDLREIMDTVSTLSSDRLGILEQALPLAEHFNDTHSVLTNWLSDMEEQVSMLSMPAMRPDLIAQQQDRNEMFVQSINEHKPLVDKLNKTGEALIRLCNDDDGAKVQDFIDNCNERYGALKLELRERQQALEKALQESSQFSDKLEGMLRALSNTADQVHNQDPISAHPPKIKEQINENDSLIDDLDKRKEAYAAVEKAADDVINKAPNRADPAIKDIKRKLDKLKNLWDDVQNTTNKRNKSLNDTLDVAQQFWRQLNAVMATLNDLQDSLQSQEPPAVEPKAIQKQQVALQEIRHEIDQTKPEVEQVRHSGQKLMQLCGEPDKPEVKKHIEDLDHAWDNITALYAKREENLIDAMEKAMEFHETLRDLLEFLKKAEEKFNRMGPLGSDIDAVKRQIEQLKNFKAEVDPHMVKVEALNRQAQELTERTSADQAASIKEPLLAVNRRWDDLLRGIVERQRQLENALLRLGQFQHALNELLVWIKKTDATLDELKPVAGDPQILEVELAKLKVLINDIQAHQTSVDTLNDAGRQIIESGRGTDEASVTQEKLNTLNTQWRSLMQKAADRQRELEDALTDAQRFNAEIQDLLSWLGDVDAIIAASKPVGGLPETATEQLERFMEVYNELEENRPKVETVLAQGQEYLKRGSNAASNLQHNLRTLKQRWDSVTARANDKKIKLEIALKEATEFHEALQAFVDWLTNAEKILTNLKPVSRVLDTVQYQIEEHKVFQKDVSAHREVMLNLDKKGTHLKYFSQKQDVILIKNLLISVQHRWERVASKSAERTRALDLGYKESKEFHDMWSGLMSWLEETEENLDELLSDSVGNDPERIKERLAKHQEFQRALSSKQGTYDNTMKTGKLIKDKAPKSDENTLKQMLIDLKNKWTSVCSKSVDRQRKLEEALLYSGQFKDAIAALLAWLRKVEKDLSEDQPVHGDLDTVHHLLDQHHRFEKDLEGRNEQMRSVMQTGHELEIKASKTDASTIRSQLTELNGLWDSVSMLTNRKSSRLEEALREAEKLHKSVHMLLEWLSEAERTLRFAGSTPEDEATAYSQLQVLEKFRKDLREKEYEKDATLELAHGVLSKSHPDAVNVIKNWITVIQSRWDEVSQWALQRLQKLNSHMQSLKDLDDSLKELLDWLQGLENTLLALKREELPMSIPATEQLIADHKEFMENTQVRQGEVDRILKAKQVKPAQQPKDPRKYGKNKVPLRGSQHDIRETSPDSYNSLGRKQSFKGSQNLYTGAKGSRTSPGREISPDPQVPHIGPRFPPTGSAEPEFKSSTVKLLYDKWRHVWMLSWERQRELYAHLAYLKEKERAENFSWDDWRKRFLKFMNHKKSRLTDLFRKMDKDNNGLIPRGDFIDGIINTKFDTNRFEMKEVADMFDRNNRGLIDWKEFIAALRPDWEEKRPDNDAQKIHDEVKRLVMLCTCRQKFRVFQVGEGKYRFGDSQKLRLVRILRSTVMVRVGGGWVALDEFLLKNDPCRVMLVLPLPDPDKPEQHEPWCPLGKPAWVLPPKNIYFRNNQNKNQIIKKFFGLISK
nr:microtubule-actin cross-linking factor 1 isoform X2 [Onthophagus taurus]